VLCVAEQDLQIIGHLPLPTFDTEFVLLDICLQFSNHGFTLAHPHFSIAP